MRISCAALLLTSLALIPSCGTPPLPEDDIPQDFLFTYTWERPTGETPDGRAVPRRIHLALDVAGVVQYEVDHVKPAPASNVGEFPLEQKALRGLYDSIRTANLYEIPETIEANDAGYGTRTFFVIGRNSPVTVTARNTPVAALDGLERELLALLPSQVLAYPEKVLRSVVLDLRSNFFHAGTCPEVEKIPSESRRVFHDPWAALNAGGRPAADCKPLENWD